MNRESYHGERKILGPYPFVELTFVGYQLFFGCVDVVMAAVLLQMCELFYAMNMLLEVKI